MKEKTISRIAILLCVSFLSALNLNLVITHPSHFIDGLANLNLSTFINNAFPYEDPIGGGGGGGTGVSWGWIWGTCGGIDNLCPFMYVGCGLCHTNGYVGRDGNCRYECYCIDQAPHDNSWITIPGDCYRWW